MASFNRVILLGNVTRDPELRYISNGTAVTDVGLAVNDRRKGPHRGNRGRIRHQGLTAADRGPPQTRHLGEGRQKELEAPRRVRADATARRSRRREPGRQAASGGRPRRPAG
jgi:hypothetical protein